MKLVIISKGTFKLGSPPGKEGVNHDERQHEVTISRDYYLGMYEVTQAQYETIMGDNPSYFQNDNLPDARSVEVTSDFPVETVSWEDAVEFCRRISALPAERATGRVYRLPTEAEWEYACRAGSKLAYSFGGDVRALGDYAWYDSNSNDRTYPVGQKKANSWGLYDMHGNVWEWCSDWYGEYPNGAVSDPQGPRTGSLRVDRGGSWDYGAAMCQSSFRGNLDPSGSNFNNGFRLALDAPVNPR
ncbi:MAG: formylglycine-generating enzyme family protein [Pirellulaceae bacterium]|nr:formylglycine-generating enzyme family protein [Pirellulaceae bacterium]